MPVDNNDIRDTVGKIEVGVGGGFVIFRGGFAKRGVRPNPRTPPPLVTGLVFPGPVCRHIINLHFPKLNNICHFSDHLTNKSMSPCNFCLSPISLAFQNSLVSSANFNILPARSTMTNAMG